MSRAAQYYDTLRAFHAQTHFEHGIVTSVQDGLVSGATAGRPNPRTRVGQETSYDLKPGDRYVSLGSGNYDMPVIFGNNPWIVG